MTAYKITEDLYIRAMTYAQKRTRTIVIAVCVIVPLAIHALKGFPQQTLISVLIVYLILAFYFLVLAPLINRMTFQRTYRNNPLLHNTQHVKLSDDAILFRSENGESSYRFAELKRLQIYPDLVMVYPTTTIFHVIPRDILGETELAILSRHQRP